MSNEENYDDLSGAELEEMMDVEFPSFNSEDEKGIDEVAPKVPMIDIQNDGWDDDAVIRCLNLAICNHDGDSDKNHYEFHPSPNMKRDTSGKQYKLECNVSGISDNLDGSGKSIKEKRSEEWNPSEMLKPKWAVNATIEDSN